MIPELRCSYSTLDPEDLMAAVIPDYRIDSPLECLFWERGANDTYQVRCAGARYSLRVYRCGAYPREAIEFEAEALDHLHRQGVSVAHPIARRSGGYLTEITAPEGLRFVLLTTFADGATPDYGSLENSRLVGESVARMHLASDGFETSRQRPRLDLRSLLEDAIAAIRPHLAHRPDDLDFIETAARDARAAVRAVPETSLDIGLCHGDLHGGNLHLHEGTVTHFDFEECGFGYRAYDLATFKWGVCLGERRIARWPAFVAGYESVRPIAEPDRSLIDTFVIVRDLSNIAFGLRNVRDFGHELAGEGSIDHACRQLRNIVGK